MAFPFHLGVVGVVEDSGGVLSAHHLRLNDGREDGHGRGHRDLLVALHMGAGINLDVRLRGHAAHNRQEHQVGDQPDDLRHLHELIGAAGHRGDARDDLDDAGEALEAVGEGDEAVVAWIRHQLLAVHHVEPARLGSDVAAQEGLEEEAAAGQRRAVCREHAAAGLADGAVADAAAAKVALAARVPLGPLAVGL
eukprot:CAMPEP_0183350774 /NCGR_PEP_ID=MMETSP0164_2-20130417/20768_1 /TAXON_ID=221442 /ORGANISM="Coccolithus pelagicus ssp braarudi, Strain PLY182g" /LENGTH=193 /DNA_ID=CAMNT_0025522757 /DNA_START=253 /DNA_END=835 /DNA_ORIENTATION=-